MSRATRLLTAAMPRARPTPRTAPTMVWEVDTGSVRRVHTSTVAAAAMLAATARDGVISVIAPPMVRITR